nr:hypothetical protein [Spirochaetota bacterium]
MKDFFEIILKLEKLLSAYEEGDLLTFVEIKELFNEIEDFSSKRENLSGFFYKKIFDDIKALNNLEKNDFYNSVLSYVRSTKEEIVGSFDEEISNETPEDNVKCPEENGIKRYPENYFANFIEDRDMLIKFMEELKEHLDN